MYNSIRLIRIFKENLIERSYPGDNWGQRQIKEQKIPFSTTLTSIFLPKRPLIKVILYISDRPNIIQQNGDYSHKTFSLRIAFAINFNALRYKIIFGQRKCLQLIENRRFIEKSADLLKNQRKSVEMYLHFLET